VVVDAECDKKIETRRASRRDRFQTLRHTGEEIVASYLLITDSQLGAFAAAAREKGFEMSDFELQEEVFDPQTAEVEARKGNVGVRCLQTDAVTVYPLGDGSDWVAAFAAELGAGRFGGRPRQ
jgi:hypothetical protein